MADGAESVGLCFTCRWMRTVTSRRGSTFYRCMRADSDPRFVRYPPLPVRACPGYERLEHSGSRRAGENRNSNSGKG
jgi:hypothetical protein